VAATATARRRWRRGMRHSIARNPRISRGSRDSEVRPQCGGDDRSAPAKVP
jgi:hypothetical protein